jgi:hypothetical protein
MKSTNQIMEETMQQYATDLRALVLTDLFPVQLVELIVKNSENLDSQQFADFYKILVTERTNLIRVFEEDDTSPQMLNGVDRTIAILKARHEKGEKL